MSVPKDDLWQLKSGTAALAVCIVRTLQKSDPDFEEQFLKNLDRAYYYFRDSDRETLHVLELLSWTRELLTGWNNVTGQGEPLLP